MTIGSTTSLRRIRRWTLTAVGLAALSFAAMPTVWADENTANEQMRQYASRPPNLGFKNQRLAARTLSANVGGTIRTKTSLPKSSEDAKKSLRKVMAAYDRRKRNTQIGATLFSANNMMVHTLIFGSLAAAPATLGTSLLIGGAAALTSYALDGLVGMMKDQSAESARIALAADLRNYFQSGAIQDFAGKTAAEKLKLLQDKGFDPVLDRAEGDPEVVAIATAEYIRILAKTTGQGLKDLADQTTANAEEIKKARKTVAGFGKALKKFKKKTNERIGAIENRVTGIQNRLDKVAEKADKNEKDVDYLQNYMFGKMDPAEQIAAIESGLLDHLTPEQQADLKEKAAIAEERKKLVEDVQKFMNGANDLFKIAGDVGINLPPEAAKLLQVGNAAAAAVTNIANGNYLGAIASVTGLFRKQGPDAATLRHQQVMNTLNSIRKDLQGIQENQQVMIGMLNSLLKGQQKIVENQGKIYERVVSLTKDVARFRREVHARLDVIDNRITTNLEAIMGQRWSSVYRCGEADRELTPSNGYEYGEFVSYEALRKFYEELGFRNDIATCLTGLAQSVSDLGKGTNIFALKFHASSGAGATPSGQRVFDFIQNYYHPVALLLEWGAHRLFKDHPAGGDGAIERALASLTGPVSDIRSLEAKIANLKTFKAPLPDRLRELLKPDLVDRLYPEDLIRTPLAMDQIKVPIKYLLKFHNYYGLALNAEDNNSELIELGDLIEVPSPRGSARTRLKRYLQLADTTVAQRNMLGGDLTVPILYDFLGPVGDPDFDIAKKVAQRMNDDPQLGNLMGVYFKDLPVPQRAQRMADALKTMMANNQVLRENFLLWALHKESKISDPARLAYEMAVDFDTPYLLKPLFRKDWNFAYEAANKTWSATIGDLPATPLPSPERLAAGQFLIAPPIHALLDLRAELIEAYLDYDVIDTLLNDRAADNLTDEGREDFAKFVLNGA